MTVTTTTFSPKAWITPEQFQQWLLGFLEGAGRQLDATQVARIKERLGSVSPWQYYQPYVQPTINPWPWPTWCGDTLVRAAGGVVGGLLGDTLKSTVCAGAAY